jgi:hypothetical protein
MHYLVMALLLASIGSPVPNPPAPERRIFVGGPEETLVLPDGCRGSDMPTAIDSFAGDILCKWYGLTGELVISVTGGALCCVSPCDAAKSDDLPAPVQAGFPHGPITCWQSEGQDLVIHISDFVLRARVTTPQEVVVLLRLASSFRRKPVASSK